MSRIAALTTFAVFAASLPFAVGAQTACPCDPVNPLAAMTAPIVDQPSPDTTVLRAGVLSNVRIAPKGFSGFGGADVIFDMAECTILAPAAAGTTSVRLDCTTSLEHAIAAQHPELSAPLAQRFTLYGYMPAGATVPMPGSSGVPCSLTRIRTATKKAAFDNSKGIGFWFNNMPENFHPVSELPPVGSATNRLGEPVVLHDFNAITSCWNGTMSSSMNAQYLFKPHIDFQGADGKLYRNWDDVSSDYRLSPSGVSSFDRTSEILP